MLSAESIKIILGRQDHTLDNTRDFDSLRSEKILVTGGMGSLGETLCDQFLNHQIDFLVTDIETLDVTSRDNVLEVLQKYKPTVIVHLAADKHAPQGELDPHSTFRINTVGTENIIWATKELRSEYLPKIVLASTCKSCDPETVYGASKLIAERLILNSGNSVVRFYNVIETAGNVFQI
jgi:FlaA1/EpsC-like NDP-sugar epimerase